MKVTFVTFAVLVAVIFSCVQIYLLSGEVAEYKNVRAGAVAHAADE